MPARNPHRPGLLQRLRPYCFGIAAPALCTALTWPLSPVLGPASVLIIYLLGVFLVAIRQGRGASVLASLMSAAAFAFFFAPPIFSLAMTQTEHIVGLSAMLVVAHVTSSLAERLRLQAAISARRESRALGLYRLSEALAGLRSEADIVATAVRHLASEFRVRSVVLFPDGEGRIGYPTEAPLQESLNGADRLRAQAVFERSDRTGKPGNDALIEADIAYVPLDGVGCRIGVLAMAPATRLGRADADRATFLSTLRHHLAQSLERMRLAEQARDAALQADAEALRNALLSAVSHDLRTPLTRIVGTASTLSEQDAGLSAAERREFTQAIQDEAQRMADLMNKVLDMARLSSGEISLHCEWNALEEIVGGTLNRLDSVLQNRPVSIRLPPGLPFVWSDAVLLQQVLMNLVENAVKYTPDGTPIDIVAATLPAAVRLAVADRGPGIPEALRSRVFDKFYRQSPEGTRTGVGLGLALCRAIVEAHGGDIGVESRAGGGAEFFLTLPVRTQPSWLRVEEHEDLEA